MAADSFQILNGSAVVPNTVDWRGRLAYTLTAGQTYTLSGEGSKGVYITLTGEGAARLILSDVSIGVDQGSEINALDISGAPGQSVEFVLPKGTDNRLVSHSGMALYVDVPVTIASDDAADSTGGSLKAISHSTANEAVTVIGDLSITGGSITAEADGLNRSGIQADGSISISGGSVTATGGLHGIFAADGGSLSVSDDAQVHATATSDGGVGMTAYGSIFISGGTVTATGAGEAHCGMEAWNTAVISGGDVTAKGIFHGIYAKSSLTVSGDASVLAEATSEDDSGIPPYGVDSRTLEVDGQADFEAYGKSGALAPYTDVTVTDPDRVLAGHDAGSAIVEWLPYESGMPRAKVIDASELTPPDPIVPSLPGGEGGSTSIPSDAVMQPEDLPQTGDCSQLAAWACLLAAALSALCVRARRRA